MENERITIGVDDLHKAETDDRFHRFSLIGWWDQQKLRDAKVLVVGAGALGNEIIKNLALLGIGNLYVADLDKIENSNLSRSVLYREGDNGRSKAEVAAARAKEIYPEMNVDFFDGNIVYDLGTGVYHWADVVIGGLDNREARLSINRNCWKVNKPWIDGAIEQINGVARVFVPDGPCYECTMSEMDWQLLNKRRSCNLLTRSEMQTGKTPTTPTISSIIAGVQCQEAVKLLHGMETIAGKGFVVNGTSLDTYLIEYQHKDDCYSHDTADEIVSLDAKSTTLTVGELLSLAREKIGADATLELGRDILSGMHCPNCDVTEKKYISLGRAGVELAECPECGQNREPKTIFTITGEEDFMERTLAEIGVPAFDILWARSREAFIGHELSGDNPNLSPKR